MNWFFLSLQHTHRPVSQVTEAIWGKYLVPPLFKLRVKTVELLDSSLVNEETGSDGLSVPASHKLGSGVGVPPEINFGCSMKHCRNLLIADLTMAGKIESIGWSREGHQRREGR